MAGESNYVLSLAITATNNAVGVIAKLASSLGPIGAAAAIAGAALIDLGVQSTKQAADFQTAMLSNVAHAGLAKSEFQSVSDAILAMAPEVGRAPTQLAEAMYPILSAFSGIQNQSAKSAIALDTLKMSFQTVAGTTVDGTAVANAAVGTFNALGLATNNVSTNTQRMTGLFDVMDKTVQLGNMQWDAYKNVVSKLAVAIQGTGISFNESQAALATMTNEGFSAQKASTYLTNTFTTMAIKTDALAAHAKKLGIAFNEQKYSSMDLAGKIEYLNKVTDGNKQKILGLLGNNATALKTFNALSVGIGSYKSNLDSLSHAQGALKSSFDEASKGMNFQMEQMKAAGDAFMITIGTQLLPVVSDFVKQMIPLVQQFTQWLEKSGALKIAASFLAGALQGLVSTIVWLATTLGNIITFFQQNEWAMDALKSVLIAFAIVVAPMVVAALVSMAAAAWAAAVPIIAMALPFIALGLVIAAFVFGVIEVYKHWGAITDWISGKTEQMHIKMELQDSQAAVKKDQQQKASAQKTLANLEKEKNDILSKLKQTHDAATKAELQHQLEMTQRQIDGQNARIAAADRDAAAQKAKQAQLHADLLEAQKSWHERFDDMVNKWVSDQLSKFDTWRQGLDSRFNAWVGGNIAALNNWRARFDAGFNAWVSSSLATINNWRQSIDNTFNSWVAGAVTWGRDLIQNLINGITSMLGNLSGAVGNVASTISSMLHFTKPDKGPLKTVDEWMPHLGDTLILGLNNISPKLQAAAIRAAASVAGPIKGTTDGAMPSHIFDFIGSNYSGYASGMATTAKREQAADNKAARQAAALSKKENALDTHIQKLENHYNIVVHAHGKGKWTKADAAELAKLLAEQTRLQGKSPQTASGRRN